MVTHFDPELAQRAATFFRRELAQLDLDPERAEGLREALEREFALVYERHFAPEREVAWRLLNHTREIEKRLREAESQRDVLQLTVSRQQETIVSLEQRLRAPVQEAS